jgi:membrane protein insertase Oxa1/YidC/SpoIIIJ
MLVAASVWLENVLKLLCAVVTFIDSVFGCMFVAWLVVTNSVKLVIMP